MMQKGDPEGNYEQFYKNDDEFLFSVIQKEEAPHEFRGLLFHDEKGPKLNIDHIKTEILTSYEIKEFDI